MIIWQHCLSRALFLCIWCVGTVADVRDLLADLQQQGPPRLTQGLLVHLEDAMKVRAVLF